MGLIVKNVNSTLRFCLSVLKFVGFLEPNEAVGVFERIYYNIYWFLWFMFLVGVIVIAQAGAMFQIWGDITLMTSASFLLFTNLALSTKIINVVIRRRAIQDIIDTSNDELSAEDRAERVCIVKSCNRETARSIYIYMWLSAVTVFGLAASAEKNQLPLRAWYPFDTSTTPAYEITYIDQSLALLISAMVNVCLDTLATSLIAVCRCRLRLVYLSLRTLCDTLDNPKKSMLSPENEAIVQRRLQQCVVKHEAALSTALKIQACFSIPILAQLSVSTVIICVTAYQLALELKTKIWMRIIPMVAYLLCMMLQVFLYCYQGNKLTEEVISGEFLERDIHFSVEKMLAWSLTMCPSSEIADAVYYCPWYRCSVSLRRGLLIIMVRTRRVAKLTAGGITTLSLSCFTSIIKASYTFFTVLKQVEDRNTK